MRWVDWFVAAAPAAAAAAAAAAVPDKIAQQHFLSVTKEGRDLQAASDSARETRVLLYFRATPPTYPASSPSFRGAGSSAGTETYPISTSGLLCLSTVCDGKFLRHNAASSVVRTQFKYGLRVEDILGERPLS